MKKGSQSRKCGRCNRIVFWLVPDEVILGIQSGHTRKVRDFRFRKENKDGSGHYYCIECLKKMFPNEY